MADRYKIDCRKFPSDQGCTVTISGSIDEVVELGWLHAKTHMRTRTTNKPESKNGLEATLKQPTTSFRVSVSE